MNVRSERQNLNYCIFEVQEINMTASELRLTEERKHYGYISGDTRYQNSKSVVKTRLVLLIFVIELDIFFNIPVASTGVSLK